MIRLWMVILERDMIPPMNIDSFHALSPWAGLKKLLSVPVIPLAGV